MRGERGHLEPQYISTVERTTVSRSKSGECSAIWDIRHQADRDVRLLILNVITSVTVVSTR